MGLGDERADAGYRESRLADLIERSSFGTPEARAARDTVSDKRARELVERSKTGVSAVGDQRTHGLAEPVASSPPCDCSCHTMPGVKHVAACCQTGLTYQTNRTQEEK